MSGRVLRAEPLAVAADPSGFPRAQAPEVAFLGRSNVGKSTLLNRLVGRRRLAHTSATPGKTRLIHFYRVERTGGALTLVDLPGYGYARVSQRERARWKPLVEGYLESGRPLVAAVLLVDLRRDPGEDEHLLIEWLRERGVPPLLVLTKSDKLKRSRRGERERAIVRALEIPDDAWLTTSAQTGAGIERLWAAIDARLAERCAGASG